MLRYLKKIKSYAKKCGGGRICLNHIRQQVKTRIIYLGNEYGGYGVAPQYLREGAIVYSFGIGEDISFDIDIMKRFNAQVYAFDPTPKSIEWIRKQRVPLDFHFFPYGLSCRDGIEKFYLPQNTDYVSGSVIPGDRLKSEYIEVKMHRLSTIMKQLQHDRVDILKMDIEGSEYMVIPDILSCRPNITQICLEVHGRFLDNGYRKTHQLIKLLNEHGYYIIYVSDSCEELTFLKNSKRT